MTLEGACPRFSDAMGWKSVGRYFGGLALAGVAVFIGTAGAVALGGAVLTIAALGTYALSRDVRRLPELVSQGAVADAEAVSV